MLKTIIHALSGFILFLTFLILRILGKKNSSDISSFIFKKIGPLTRYNKVAIKNILFVWPKKNKTAIDNLTKRMWANIGRNFGEFVHLKKLNPLTCSNIKVIGLKKVKTIIEKNKSKKKGMIFVSAHYGNWELGPIIIKKLNLEPLSLYRKSNNRFIEIIIQRVRSNNGRYAPKGDTGAKKSFLWIRNGKCLALLNDQKLNEGPLINFLGKPAPTASFLAELALRMELDIIPIKFQRTSKYKSTITFMEKIKSPPSHLKHHNKVNKILEEVNSIISSWILEKPDQWFWVHRRWSKKFYKT